MQRLLGFLVRRCNETASDRPADLADAAGDRVEPSELLDEGSMRAGLLLTRRAVATGDVRALQEICDAGTTMPGASWTDC